MILALTSPQPNDLPNQTLKVMKRVQLYVRFLVDSLLFLHPLEGSGSGVLYRNSLIIYTVALLAARGIAMHLYLKFSSLETPVIWLGRFTTSLALTANALVTYNLITKADKVNQLQKLLSNFQVNVPRKSYWYELTLTINIFRAIGALAIFGQDTYGFGTVTSATYQVARMRIELTLAQLGYSISYLTSVFGAVNQNLRGRPHPNLLVTNRLISGGFAGIELLNDVWGLFMANCVFLYLIELVQYSMNMRTTITRNSALYLQLYILSIVICGVSGTFLKLK